MNTKSNAIASSQISKVFFKIYRIAILFPHLTTKAITKPKYIWLCLWAFQQLWWVDSRLKDMALEALQTPGESKSAIWTPELKQAIRQRVIAIAWTAKIHPLRPKCLHRSLVLYNWLREQGITPKLEVGWGDKIGHAWVTYNDIVLNDRADIANVTPRLSRV
ncbi:lasso peptide biosynthesis B2 protein [Stanieria cyanosphaera]|nr:lasso peptide biosynthesis B2 protein [Stanieria cyanosphaera]